MAYVFIRACCHVGIHALVVPPVNALAVVPPVDALAAGPLPRAVAVGTLLMADVMWMDSHDHLLSG